MGTNAVLQIVADNEELITIYKHYDGGIHSFGKFLANFCAEMHITNGLPLRSHENVLNGSGDFAALLLSEMKNEPGNVYIIPHTQITEDYDNIYTVSFLTNYETDVEYIASIICNNVVFNSVEDFVNFTNNQ